MLHKVCKCNNEGQILSEVAVLRGKSREHKEKELYKSMI
jgi:hypothetical protein